MQISRASFGRGIFLSLGIFSYAALANEELVAFAISQQNCEEVAGTTDGQWSFLEVHDVQHHDTDSAHLINLASFDSSYTPILGHPDRFTENIRVLRAQLGESFSQLCDQLNSQTTLLQLYGMIDRLDLSEAQQNEFMLALHEVLMLHATRERLTPTRRFRQEALLIYRPVFVPTNEFATRLANLRQILPPPFDRLLAEIKPQTSFEQLRVAMSDWLSLQQQTEFWNAAVTIWPGILRPPLNFVAPTRSDIQTIPIFARREEWNAVFAALPPSFMPLLNRLPPNTSWAQLHATLSQLSFSPEQRLAVLAAIFAVIHESPVDNLRSLLQYALSVGTLSHSEIMQTRDAHASNNRAAAVARVAPSWVREIDTYGPDTEVLRDFMRIARDIPQDFDHAAAHAKPFRWASPDFAKMSEEQIRAWWDKKAEEFNRRYGKRFRLSFDTEFNTEIAARLMIENYDWWEWLQVVAPDTKKMEYYWTELMLREGMEGYISFFTKPTSISFWEPEGNEAQPYTDEQRALWDKLEPAQRAARIPAKNYLLLTGVRDDTDYEMHTIAELMLLSADRRPIQVADAPLSSVFEKLDFTNDDRNLEYAPKDEVTDSLEVLTLYRKLLDGAEIFKFRLSHPSYDRIFLGQKDHFHYSFPGSTFDAGNEPYHTRVKQIEQLFALLCLYTQPDSSEALDDTRIGFFQGRGPGGLIQLYVPGMRMANDGHFETRNHFTRDFITEAEFVWRWVNMPEEKFQAELKSIMTDLAERDPTIAERLRPFIH